MSRKADREREDRRRVAETIDSPVAAPRPTSPVPMRANGDANMASSSSSQDEGISVLQAQLHEVRFAYNVALRHTSACPIFKVSNHHLTGAIRIALEMTLKLFQVGSFVCSFRSTCGHAWSNTPRSLNPSRWQHILRLLLCRFTIRHFGAVYELH